MAEPGSDSETTLSSSVNDELTIKLGLRLDYWKESHRSGAVVAAQANYPDYRDKDGIVGPLPASDGQRQIPEAGFFTGPEIGDPLPGFALRSQW